MCSVRIANHTGAGVSNRPRRCCLQSYLANLAGEGKEVPARFAGVMPLTFWLSAECASEADFDGPVPIFITYDAPTYEDCVAAKSARRLHSELPAENESRSTTRRRADGP